MSKIDNRALGELETLEKVHEVFDLRIDSFIETTDGLLDLIECGVLSRDKWEKVHDELSREENILCAEYDKALAKFGVTRTNVMSEGDMNTLNARITEDIK